MTMVLVKKQVEVTVDTRTFAMGLAQENHETQADFFIKFYEELLKSCGDKYKTSVQIGWVTDQIGEESPEAMSFYKEFFG